MAAQSTTAEDSPGTGTQLFDLPQEIQDMIFDYAYPKVNDLKILYKRTWDFKEKRKRKERGKGYKIQQFPSLKVDEFLVSKRFYLAAAKAFIGNQLWIHPYPYAWESKPRDNNIICKFSKTAVDSLSAAGHIDSLPSLRKITFEVDQYPFETLKTRYPWEQQLTAADFKEVADHYRFGSLAKLQEFNFKFGRSYYIRTKDERDTWDSNMRGFEAYVRAYVEEEKAKKHDAAIDDTEQVVQIAVETLEDSNVFSQEEEASTVPGEIKFTRMVLDLPETTEEMMTLLGTDGGKVMDLVRVLKSAVKTKQGKAGRE